MFLARVVGSVVSPVQHSFLEGRTLLSIRPVDLDGVPDGRPDGVAVDRAQAGPGDLVLVLKEGSSARDLFEEEQAPVRTVIVGVVDEVEVEGRIRARNREDAG